MIGPGALRLLLMVALVLGLAASGARAAETAPPVDEGLPIRVNPTVRIDQITEISEKDSVFKPAMTLTYAWRDRRLAFDRHAAGRDRFEFINDAATAKLATMWSPGIVLLNSTDAPKSRGMILVIHEDGMIELTEKVAAVLEVDYEFADFPFDRQRLIIRLGSSEFSRETVLVRDPVIMTNPKLSVKNWQILRSTADIGEAVSITGRPLSIGVFAVEVKRSAYVAVTQIFMPYLAIIFLPLICLFNIGPSTPTQLFTALLALLTLNFKVVLEQPTIISVSNSVVDAMWMGYCFIGINLILAFTIMRARPADAPPLPDLYQELRKVVMWAVPVAFLVVVGGRILLAQN